MKECASVYVVKISRCNATPATLISAEVPINSIVLLGHNKFDLAVGIALLSSHSCLLADINTIPHLLLIVGCRVRFTTYPNIKLRFHLLI